MLEHVQFSDIDTSEKFNWKELSFQRRDWLALLGTLICSAAYAFGHSSILSRNYQGLPGIGLTLFSWAMLLICMGYMGYKQLKWTRQSIFLLTACVLLSATYGIFASGSMRTMNLPVLILLGILSVYSLDDRHCGNTAASFCMSIANAFRSMRRYFPAPFHALLNSIKGTSGRHFKELLLGLILCIPIIGILLLLLCDADSVFLDMVSQLESLFHQPQLLTLLWNILRILVLAPLCFAFVYGMTHTIPPKQKNARTLKLPKATIIVPLVAVCALYLVFVYVQIRFLFTGKAMMGGEYASYARSGFFQLVLVALITLMIVMPVLIKHPRSHWLRLLCSMIVLLTMAIVFSAFWRMRLYILEFGFTLLRAVTLWGMLAITATMLAALLKALHPNAAIFQPLLIFTICTWLMFNYCNINARITEYNINAYLNGSIETLDIYYLEDLGVDALPQMHGLLESEILPVEMNMKLLNAVDRIHADAPAGFEWCLNCAGS